MKIPFLSRLLEIKELQLGIEKSQLQSLSVIASELYALMTPKQRKEFNING